MCGRYYFDINIKELREILANMKKNSDEPYKTDEIFPTNIAPIITCKGTILAKWGFPNLKGKGVIINARMESLHERIMFKNLVNTQRCIIPASGFFEWKRNPSGARLKDKYFFKNPNSVLYMAGLYNTFQDRDEQLSLFSTNKEQPSFVIITQNSNEYMGGIHDRMPLIFNKDEMQAWLRGENLNNLLHGNNTILEYSIF